MYLISRYNKCEIFLKSFSLWRKQINKIIKYVSTLYIKNHLGNKEKNLKIYVFLCGNILRIRIHTKHREIMHMYKHAHQIVLQG